MGWSSLHILQPKTQAETVIPNSHYGDRVPIILGTLHIDLLLEVDSGVELKALGKYWQGGELSTEIAMKQAQFSDNVNTLESIQGNVKMIKNITLEPLETRQVSCILKCSFHSIRIKVVISFNFWDTLSNTQCVPSCCLEKEKHCFQSRSLS